MPFSQQTDITGMLLAWGQGDQSALDKLIPLVYEDLRRIARDYMQGERSGHTLQTTALVHEAYERLVDTPRVQWHDRAHFLAVCAQLMRRVLVDYARSRRYLKRGAGAPVAVLDEALQVPCEQCEDFTVIDQALSDLAKFDLRKSQVVELKFFGGLTVQETAVFLKVSPETVLRDWKAAKAWMLRYLAGASRDEGPEVTTGAEGAHGR